MRRISTLLLALLTLIAAVAAQAETIDLHSPVYIFTFHTDENGVIQPDSVRRSNTYGLSLANNEELAMALGETDEMRRTTAIGHVVVRSRDQHGTVFAQTVVEAGAWRHADWKNDTGQLRGEEAPDLRPGFLVSVPQTATTITVDGWLPGTHGTYDVAALVAELEAQAQEPPPIPDKTKLEENRINLVFLGDGYDKNQQGQFNTDVTIAKQMLFGTEPFKSYEKFFNVIQIYTESPDSGATHPICSGDPVSPVSKNTRYGTTFCTGGIARDLSVTKTGKIASVITQSITNASTWRFSRRFPPLVIMLVNDQTWGGSGARDAAVISMGTTSELPHEVGHTFGDLSDEYADYALDSRATCSDLNGIPCKANVTNDASLDTVKWGRWIDNKAIAPLCGDAHCRNTTNQFNRCGPGVGLFEGANYNACNYFRSQENCKMRTPGPTPYCAVCSEQLVRKFYQNGTAAFDIRRIIDPVTLASKELLATTKGPRRVQLGTNHRFGGEVLRTVAVGTGDATGVHWFLNGDDMNRSDDFIEFAPPRAGTYVLRMQAEDVTPLVRLKPGENRHALHMEDSYTWMFDVPAKTVAVSSGTDPVTASAALDVPKGARNISLHYTIKTLEPGGRLGDSWAVRVGYGSPSALAAGEFPYQAKDTITDPQGNKTVDVTLDIDTSSAVTLDLDVSVQNLEKEEPFIPTTVEATLTYDSPACLVDCSAACLANPYGDGCPFDYPVLDGVLMPMTRDDEQNRSDNSYVSIGSGEKVRNGRHIVLHTPKDHPKIRSVEMTARVLRTDGSEITQVRNVKWFKSAPALAHDQGLDHPDDHTWDFNVAQKESFTDDPLPRALTEGELAHGIKYRIDVAATLTDETVAVSYVDVDDVLTNAPTAPLQRQPLHALWHDRNVQQSSVFWASLATHRWLSAHASLLHLPDLVTDEHAAHKTPFGHETGTAITEVPYYPGAIRYTTNAANFTHAYYDFRDKTITAANPAAAPADREAARQTLIAWVQQTRTHLENLAASEEVLYIKVYSGEALTPLPDSWLSALLVTGRIGDPAAPLVDIWDAVGGEWRPENAWKIFLTKNASPFQHDVYLDRCKLGEIGGPCHHAGGPILVRTHIIASPQSTTINSEETAHLSVLAEGEGLRYQWYMGNPGQWERILRDETRSALDIIPPASMSYWVAVVGEDGAVAVSDAAIVTVRGTGGPCVPPVVDQQPPEQITIMPEQTATILAHATGTNLRYQWYVADLYGGGIAIEGAVGATYAATSGGSYYVVISNECGTTTSASCVILISGNCQAPGVQAMQSSSQMITPGQPVQLSLVPTGKPPVEVYWYEQKPGETGSQVAGHGLSITVYPTVDGTEYRAGLSNSCGSIMIWDPIVISLCAPAQITSQPVAPLFTQAGQTKTLSVAAIGTHLHYQWFSSSAPIDVDAPSLNIPAPLATTYYHVVVSNECGTVTSAEVTVQPPCDPPVVTAQPAGGTVLPGQTITLTAGLSGSSAYAKWMRRVAPTDPFQDVPQVIGTTLQVTPDAVGSVDYKLRATNACGTVDSDVATVTACHPTAITVQPQPALLAVGASTTLTVGASGDALSYQWFAGVGASATPVGTNSPTLTVTPSATTVYRARVTGMCGTVDSAAVTVTVCSNPIQQQPAASPALVLYGQSSTVTVTSSGSGLHYQWFAGAAGDTTSPVGTDSASLATGGLTQNTTYWVRVTNGACSQDSADVTVFVCQPPAASWNAAVTQAKSAQSQTLSVTGPAGSWVSWYTGNAPGGADAVQIAAGLSRYTLAVAPTTTTKYWVRVYAGNTAGGICYTDTPVLTINVCVPQITTQPSSQTVTTGSTAHLAVVSDLAASYQWYTGNAGDTSHPVSGATSSTLDIAPSSTTTYWVRVNGCTSANSTAATVTVCRPPAITLQPAATAIWQPASADLFVAATGDGLAYQWYSGTSTNTPVGTNAATLHVTPSATTSYWVRVTGSCGTVNSGSATVTVCTNLITQQPASAVVVGGQPATLTVGTTGSGLHYQWYRGAAGDTSAPVGSDSATLNTGALLQDTPFWVRVTNGTCTQDSTAAVMTVCNPPGISWGGATTQARKSQAQTLIVAAPQGLPAAWYQGTSGNTSTLLATGTGKYTMAIAPGATTSYWVRVWSASGSCFSDTTSLTINVCVPQIVTQPAAQTVAAGTPAQLSVGVDIPNVTYQWYAGAKGTTTQPVSGGTSATLSVTPGATTSYWVRVTGCTVVDSNAATVTVCTPPAITVQPRSTTINLGQSIDLFLGATGTGLSYQWYSGASTPVGTNSATLHVTPSTTTSYHARVTGSCGSVDTVTVTVTVCDRFITSGPNASDTVVFYGNSTSLSVSAIGSGLHYHWYQGTPGDKSQPFGGDTATVTSPVIYADTQFWVEVTNSTCVQQSGAIAVQLWQP